MNNPPRRRGVVFVGGEALLIARLARELVSNTSAPSRKTGRFSGKKVSLRVRFKDHVVGLDGPEVRQPRSAGELGAAWASR